MVSRRSSIQQNKQDPTHIKALHNKPQISAISFSDVSLGIWACYTLAKCSRPGKARPAPVVDFPEIFAGRLTSETAPALRDALVSGFLDLPNPTTIQLPSARMPRGAGTASVTTPTAPAIAPQQCRSLPACRLSLHLQKPLQD